MCTICGNIAGDPDTHLARYGHTPVTAGAAPEHEHEHH